MQCINTEECNGELYSPFNNLEKSLFEITNNLINENIEEINLILLSKEFMLTEEKLEEIGFNSKIILGF